MAIPTAKIKIAKIVLNSVLSIFSPIFCPTWTPSIEPKINIVIKTKSIVP